MNALWVEVCLTCERPTGVVWMWHSPVAREGTRLVQIAKDGGDSLTHEHEQLLAEALTRSGSHRC